MEKKKRLTPKEKLTLKYLDALWLISDCMGQKQVEKTRKNILKKFKIYS